MLVALRGSVAERRFGLRLSAIDEQAPTLTKENEPSPSAPAHREGRAVAVVYQIIETDLIEVSVFVAARTFGLHHHRNPCFGQRRTRAD